MSDDIDTQQLEQAEEELEKQLWTDTHAPPTCPACGGKNTVRLNNYITFGIVFVTVAQQILFLWLHDFYAILSWLPLPIISLLALLYWIYLPDYHCRQCHQIFKTKPKRIFT